MLSRLLLCLGAGLLLSTAFEPIGWAWMAPGSLALLALSLHGLRGWRAALSGLLFGVGFFFVLQWWMRAVGTDAWLGLSGLEAAFMVPLALLWTTFQRTTRWWPLWCSFAWVAVEAVRSSWPFSGMPWGRLSYASADSVWAQALPWVGFTGVSFAMAATGTGIAWVLLNRDTAPVRSRLWALTPVAATLLLALLPSTLTSPALDRSAAQDVATVALVQGDVPGAGNDLISVHREVTENQVRATRELGAAIDAGTTTRPDFVLWPENSTAVDPFRDSRARSGIESAVDAVNTPVLVGAMVDGERDDHVLNQGIVWSPVTGPGDRYTKWHPVPFGEYIPWRDLVFQNNLGRLQQIGRDMLSGDRSAPLRVGNIAVANAICFDVAYDDGLHAQIKSGARMVTVQTSNAMFIHTDQIDQQYEITRLRAIETGRAVAVAATNGVSGIIGPDGRPIVESPVQTTSTVQSEVPLSSQITPAVWWGAWPGRLAVLVTLSLAVWIPMRRSVAYIRHRASRPPSV